MKPDPVRFEVMLRALDDPSAAMHGERFEREPSYRLRLALKRLLRDFGLRCESVRRVPDSDALLNEKIGSSGE